MWVAKFQLKDDMDIYTPLCVKHKIEFFVNPYTNYIKENHIHLLLGGTISGTESSKKEFVKNIKKDKRIARVERYKDFMIR